MKCILGKATDDNYKEAYEWIHSKEENKRYFDTLYHAWLASGLTRKIDPKIEQQVWERLNLGSESWNKIVPSHKNRWFISFLKIAATITIIFLMGFFSNAYLSKKQKSAELYTVEAPKGAKSRVTLADGTHVWLNAGSKLQYASNYNDKLRDIYLTGEAYFEVAKNKFKPFKVHAGGIIVKALGTIFNVKAYPEEELVETTLVEGSVSIEKTGMNKDKEPFILKPSQHAIYYKTQSEVNVVNSGKSLLSSVTSKSMPVQPGKIVLMPKIEPEVYTSWKDKRWVFHSEPFGNFAQKLERLYDIQIVMDDPKLKEYKLTGSIEEENIEMVLKALQFIIPIEYKFEHKQLIITMNDNMKNKYYRQFLWSALQ